MIRRTSQLNKGHNHKLQIFIFAKNDHTSMNILLLGSGGREHTMAWKIKQSPHCSQLYISPGNAGTQQIGQNIDIDVEDFDQLVDFALTHQIDMVVVGPEVPLVSGIVDYFQQSAANQVMIIGPSQAAAQLEGSKDYAKAFMAKYGIPTASYRNLHFGKSRKKAVNTLPSMLFL